jgi:hypothetical protein
MTTTARTRRRWRRPLSVEAVTIPSSPQTTRITTRVSPAGAAPLPSWAASKGVGSEGERRRLPWRLGRPPSRLLSHGREHSHLRA